MVITKMKSLLKIVLMILVSHSLFSQTDMNEKVEFEPTFNVLTGSDWIMKEHKNSVLVVIFNAHNCPYTKLYENRIAKLSKSYMEKGVSFVLVNANTSDENSEANMVKTAKEKSYNFPYLSDKKQQLATKLGALKTPEVFVFSNKNGVHYLKYRGAIDDNPQVENDTKNTYLKDAIEILFNGKNISTQETRAIGCMIK
jgi:thiol-disulfide isomerase/thioredoxin